MTRFELATTRPPDEYSKPDWATSRCLKSECKVNTLFGNFQTLEHNFNNFLFFARPIAFQLHFDIHRIFHAPRELTKITLRSDKATTSVAPESTYRGCIIALRASTIAQKNLSITQLCLRYQARWWFCACRASPYCREPDRDICVGRTQQASQQRLDG